MLYRHADGSFTWSWAGPDWIEPRKMTREEGLKYIREYAGIPDDIREKLLTETAPGFVIS